MSSLKLRVVFIYISFYATEIRGNRVWLKSVSTICIRSVLIEQFHRWQYSWIIVKGSHKMRLLYYIIKTCAINFVRVWSGNLAMRRSPTEKSLSENLVLKTHAYISVSNLQECTRSVCSSASSAAWHTRQTRVAVEWTSRCRRPTWCKGLLTPSSVCQG